MKKILHSLAVAIPLLLANSALAQHQTFTVDSQTSDVSIDLGGSDHSVHGTFHVQSGSIDFSRGTPSISGSVIVAAGSGKTGNDSRDKKMTNEVLDAPHFAEISFFPKSYQGTIAPTGDSTIQVTGTFALHGAAHEMTLPMQIHIDGSKATARAKFVVPYVQWGLKNPSFMFWKAENDVAIDLNLVGQVSN